MYRRDAIRLLVLGGGAVVVGCGHDAADDLVCTDTVGLTREEAELRTTLQYTDHSPHTDKMCSNCQLNIPSPTPNTCGRCNVLKGPVHPQGYCTSWAVKQT